MGTNAKFALMRRVAHQGAHRSTPGLSRNSIRFASEKIPVRGRKGYSSVSRRHRLGRYFQITVEKLKPFWQGALETFSSNPSAGNLSRNNVAKGFSNAQFYSSTPSTALGRFATMRARLPSGPHLKPSIRHGAGLQSARSFSSGPQGARLFESVITNAPLALRAAGCELQDPSKTQSHLSQAMAFAQSLVSHRYGVNCGFQSADSISKYSDLLFDGKSDAAASKQSYKDSYSTMQRPEMTCDFLSEEETNLFAREAELNRFFHEPVRREVSRKWVVTMYVPLEPDIPEGDFWKHSATLEEDNCMLDNAMFEKLETLQGIYRAHRMRLQALERLLREIHVWPKHLSVADLCRTAESEHTMALQIDLADWRKERIMQLIQDRFGSLDWLSISESYVS